MSVAVSNNYTFSNVEKYPLPKKLLRTQLAGISDGGEGGDM